MPIIYTMGDILINSDDVQAIAHECDPLGRMNTHIGVKIRQRYARLYDEYYNACQAQPPQVQLGSVLMGQGYDGMWVFHLIVIEDEFYRLASPKIIGSAFQEMRRIADENGIESIAMPPIGGGIGLLMWDDARNQLERAFRKWNGKLYVYLKRPKEEREPRKGE